MKRRNAKYIIGIVLTLLIAIFSIENGKNVRIIDGDTLELNGEKFRLKGIDAPEMDQICLDTKQREYECGVVAKEYLQELIEGRNVKCMSIKRDKYNRVLGNCFVGEILINQELVRFGWAVAYMDDGKYKLDEKYARDHRLGMWHGSFQKPSEWRKTKKAVANIIY